MSLSVAGEEVCSKGGRTQGNSYIHTLENMYKNVYGSSAHNNKVLDATQCQSTKEQYKNVVYSQNGLLYHSHSTIT